MRMLEYGAENYGAKSDVVEGLHFVLKAKRLQGLITERNLDSQNFRAKDLNQVGDGLNTMEFMGATLMAMSWKNYISEVGTRKEPVTIEEVIGFEYLENGRIVFTENSWNIPTETLEGNRWSTRVPYKSVMGKRTVMSTYNVYKLNPTVFENVKAFVIESLKTL